MVAATSGTSSSGTSLIQSSPSSSSFHQTTLSNQATSTDDSDFESDSDASTTSQLSILDFNESRCLFCTTTSTNLDSNMLHMTKHHNFTIPSPDQLAVDTSALLTYLHLLIHGYFECLSCKTQRRNAQAIQQHMTCKNHCNFDISNAESEFREFYDFESKDEESFALTKTSGLELEKQEGSLALSSGKTALHRTSRFQKPRNTISSTSSTTSASTTISASTQLTKHETRDLALSARLSNLRTSDRLSLLHLPSSQQRAILNTQKKQLQKARRQERSMQARVQSMGNKTLMKHFVSDVPGPKLG